VDETYLKISGRWCYLYRAIDRDGNLVDTMLSEHRDMAAAQAFFRSAKAATGVTPERVTTDGHGSYPRAIRIVLGRRVVHRTSAYKNNGLEQDHRGVKGRTRCMRGFKSFASAERFCRGYDELRHFLRAVQRCAAPWVSPGRNRSGQNGGGGREIGFPDRRNSDSRGGNRGGGCHDRVCAAAGPAGDGA
jgi:putative transposase